MEKQGDERLPQFPSSPDGIARMEHLPTVEASIRYWEAVRVYAIETRQPALELTAVGLRSSYEQALQELTNAEQSQKEKRRRVLDVAGCSLSHCATTDRGLMVISAPSTRAGNPGFVARQRLVRRLVWRRASSPRDLRCRCSRRGSAHPRSRACAWCR